MLSEYPTWLLTTIGLLDLSLVVGCSVYVLRRPREPRAMLVWILSFILLPVLGALLFFLMGEPKINRVRRRRHSRKQKLGAVLDRAENLRQIYHAGADHGLPRQLARFMETVSRINKQPPLRGNLVKIFHDSEDTFAALQQAIQAAEHHIHLEYYIFRDDQAGWILAKLLIQQARRGVHCRLLLDYVGCWSNSRRFTQHLRENGVEVAFFSPMLVWRESGRMNLRNHRKIVVIDGKIGFTGSQNIGNEYVGLCEAAACWHDTHMRIEGPAAHGLQEIFIEDWHYSTGTELSGDAYFALPDTPPGEQVVHIIASGPDERAHVMHHLLLAVISSAEHSIHIATPYFVPDAAMLLTLQSAAYRGVRVKLIIPRKSDHILTLWAGRSYYSELCATGVEVYEYTAGMLHSKVAVIDTAWGMVGSANMDERSFRLNFEVTTLLYDTNLAYQLETEFSDLLRQSRPFCAAEKMAWSYRESLLIGLARLVSPML